MQVKRCNKCESDKSVEDFNKNKNKSDGLSSICKSCHKKYRSEHYKANKEKVINQVKEYRINNPDKYGRINPDRKSGRTIECECSYKECNKTIYTSKTEIKQNYNRFCSSSCSNKSRKKSPFLYQYNSIKKRSARKGREFNLTLEDIKNLFITQKGKCALTNLPLKVNTASDETKLYETASLDRIDSSKGYTRCKLHENEFF